MPLLFKRLQQSGKISVLCLLSVILLSACSWTKPQRPDTEQRRLSERYVEMGVRYMEFGKFRVAKQKLEQALDIDDNNANAHNSIAVYYEQIKDDDQAEDHFQEALSLAPNDPTVLTNYGRFLCNNNALEQGMGLLSKAAETPLNERLWFALTNLGQCHFMQGNSAEAERYFRQALQYDSGYPPALLSMAEISYEKSTYMKTRAFLERFLNYRKATPKALLLGFLAEQALGQELKAEQYKAELILRFPLSDEAIKIQQMQEQILKPKAIPSRLIPSTDAVETNEAEPKQEN